LSCNQTQVSPIQWLAPLKNAAAKRTATLRKLVRDPRTGEVHLPSELLEILRINRDLGRTLLTIRWHDGGDCVVCPADIEEQSEPDRKASLTAAGAEYTTTILTTLSAQRAPQRNGISNSVSAERSIDRLRKIDTAFNKLENDGWPCRSRSLDVFFSVDAACGDSPTCDCSDSTSIFARLPQLQSAASLGSAGRLAGF
jgi:hypothetical protein